jgi:predicted ribosomally synthesized peptide with SipW-like signal peptide
VTRRPLIPCIIQIFNIIRRTRMKRSILLSLLIMGVAGTVLAIAGTQAVFTDTQTASGNVNAGTLDLYLLESGGGDDNGADEFVFDIPAGTTDFLENLLPGGTATDILRLRNDGTATLTIASLSTAGSTGAECDADNAGDDFTVSVAGVSVGNTLAPGAAVDVTITVTLAAGVDNDCQGDTYGFQLVVGVSS